ncbi:unnamed protein product, partial [Prorocentrum cordatum]
VSAPDAAAKKKARGAGTDKDAGTGRMMHIMARLVLRSSREVAEVCAATYLKYEAESGQGLVAVCVQAGKAYEEDSKALRTKSQKSDTVNHHARGPPHLPTLMAACHYGATKTIPECDNETNKKELQVLKTQMHDPWEEKLHTVNQTDLHRAVPYFRVRPHRKKESESQTATILRKVDTGVKLG